MPHSLDITADITLAMRLADAAGAAIRPHFRTNLASERKADASPVTLADRAAEQAMHAILAAERPADTIIGEEFGRHEGTSGRAWVLDPIDGTAGFLAGRPIFGTLIALVIAGVPSLGVIDQPVLAERWLGAVGQPTTLNGQRVRTRACSALGQATIATTGPHYFTADDNARYTRLARRSDYRRMVMGGDCYNYAMLASGQLDIVCEAGLKFYDWAALVPVIEGAGGVVCDWQGAALREGVDGHVLALGDATLRDAVLAELASAG